MPYGKSGDDNVEVRRHLKPTEFDFESKAHWDIGESLGILNFEQAAKITGARFTVYHGLGARLKGRSLILCWIPTPKEAIRKCSSVYREQGQHDRNGQLPSSRKTLTP